MSDKNFQKNKKTAADLKRVQVQQAANILVVCEGQTEGVRYSPMSRPQSRKFKIETG